jgi:hypothetical protein
MNGLEEAAMRAVEERVRDAFGAAAETVTAQDLPGPPSPAGRAPARGVRARAARMRTRAFVTVAFVPVAAAAAVTIIIVTAALVVPNLLTGPRGGRSPGVLAGAPAYFAGVAGTPPTVVNIYRSATGRVVASFPTPRHLKMFTAVARLGGDRGYVVAAVTSNECTTRLYRFRIDSRGRPSGLTPLSVPKVTGAVGELVGSTAGNVLAFTAAGPCTPRARTPVGVIHLATRQVTTWTFQSARRRWDRAHTFKYWEPYATAGSLSLTADGSVLGFLAGSDRRDGPQDVWVLPTSSPPGPLTRHARKVLHLRTAVFRVVLNHSGLRAYVETLSAPRGGAVVLDLYSTSTGQRTRSLGRLGPGGQNLAELPITVDASGVHLIAYGYASGPRVTILNLATGRRASATAADLVVEGALTTVAW